LNVDRNALKKKCRFSVSPDTDEMRQPSAFRNSKAEVLRAPRFSTVIGWKIWLDYYYYFLNPRKNEGEKNLLLLFFTLGSKDYYYYYYYYYERC